MPKVNVKVHDSLVKKLNSLGLNDKKVVQLLEDEIKTGLSSPDDMVEITVDISSADIRKLNEKRKPTSELSEDIMKKKIADLEK